MKKTLLFLSLLLLTGCNHQIPKPEPSVSESISSTAQQTPSNPQETPSTSTKEEDTSHPSRETITVYYFQIYLDNIGQQFPKDIDYRFSKTFPYGTKFGTDIYDDKQVAKYPPKYTYGDGARDIEYYTSLDPLCLDESKLVTAEKDRILYFATIG